MSSVLNKTSLDSATSSVVALVMILGILAVCAGVWALIVVPEEIRTEYEIEASSAVSALSDITLMSEKMDDSTVYFALPAGTIRLENCGEVYTEFGETVPLTTLVYSPGGKSSFGIMAGGVWRMDFGNAAWILYPRIIFEDETLRFNLPVFSGNAAYGSSNPIPIGIEIKEHNPHTVSGDSIRISVTTDEEWAADLFETLFTETRYSYENLLDTDISQNGNRVTAEFSSKSGKTSLELDEKRYMIYTGDKI